MEREEAIKVIEDIREYYLQPVIQRDKRWKIRAEALSFALKALKNRPTENPIQKWAKHPKVIEARKLLMEADKDLLREYKDNLAADRCRCGHSRANHLPTHSINYIEGMCRICHTCKGFIHQRYMGRE